MKPAWEELLHTLWTKAVGTKDYSKKEWIEFQRVLTELQAERDKFDQELALREGDD